MLAIVGVVGIISPISLDISVLYLSFPILLVYTILLVPIIKTGYTVSRKEGILLLAGYLFYLWGVLNL
jgi:cation:H+ antiporter